MVTPGTTVRLTAEDRDILLKLSRLTGLANAQIIRLAIRAELAKREKEADGVAYRARATR
jgi:predicted DNA-binding protein